MIDERFEFLVVAFAIRQSRRSLRFRADNRDSGVFEFKKFARKFDRRLLSLREDDDGIGRAPGERDFPVLDDGAVEKNLRTASVEVPEELVFIGRVREGGIGRDVDCRRFFLVEEQNVGGRKSALQDALDTRHILRIPLAPGKEREPRLRSVEMHPVRTERQPRRVVVRLRAHAMKKESIDARAERPVSLTLRGARMLTPFVEIAREGLRRDDRLTASMRARDRLKDAETRVESVAVGPEFAHRDVGCAEEPEVARRVQIVRFRREFKPALRRELLHSQDVVIVNQLLTDAPQVPKKTLRFLDASDNASKDCGRARQRIVTPTLSEELAEVFRPVLRRHFPTVVMKGREFRDVEEFIVERGEMRFDSRAFELVAFESESRQRRGARRLPGQTSSETHDRPVAFGRVPSERSVGVHFVGEVDDCVDGNDRVVVFVDVGVVRNRREKGFDAGRRRVGRTVEERLFLPVGESQIAFRSGEGDDGDVAVVIRPDVGAGTERTASEIGIAGRWDVERDFDGLPSFDAGFRGAQVLHRMIRVDPRTAGAAPSGSDARREIDAEFFRMARGVAPAIEPFGGHVFDFAARTALVRLHHDSASKTGVFERVKIGAHPFFREITVEKEPVDAGLGAFRGIRKGVAKTCAVVGVGGD